MTKCAHCGRKSRPSWSLQRHSEVLKQDATGKPRTPFTSPFFLVLFALILGAWRPERGMFLVSFFSRGMPYCRGAGDFPPHRGVCRSDGDEMRGMRLGWLTRWFLVYPPSPMQTVLLRALGFSCTRPGRIEMRNSTCTSLVASHCASNTSEASILKLWVWHLFLDKGKVSRPAAWFRRSSAAFPPHVF